MVIFYDNDFDKVETVEKSTIIKNEYLQRKLSNESCCNGIVYGNVLTIHGEMSSTRNKQ